MPPPHPYVQGVMVRLMLVLAPVMCVLSGIAVTGVLSVYMKNLDIVDTKAKKKKADTSYPVKNEVGMNMVYIIGVSGHYMEVLHIWGLCRITLFMGHIGCLVVYLLDCHLCDSHDDLLIFTCVLDCHLCDPHVDFLTFTCVLDCHFSDPHVDFLTFTYVLDCHLSDPHVDLLTFTCVLDCHLCDPHDDLLSHYLHISLHMGKVSPFPSPSHPPPPPHLYDI